MAGKFFNQRVKGSSNNNMKAYMIVGGCILVIFITVIIIVTAGGGSDAPEPIIEINGERYMCMLESPHMLKFPWSIFFATSNSFGFKFVYLYKYI